MHTNEAASPDSSHSRWMGWTLGLLAVPVLYVLTLPPFAKVLQNQGYQEFDSLPQILRYYFIPGIWVYEKSPARKFMAPYADWWDKMLPAP
jgi:hypothetical protein